jgi:predicted nuclease of predicted toxin-antitoxin system
MRFLVDAQLPPALARFLVERGHEAEHVLDVGLLQSDDSAIWDYALRSSAVIVTKDEDFATRITLDEQGPPIVWVRIGNTTRRELLGRLEPLLPSISAALTAGEKLVEIV